jgi:hypothetical protein
MPKDEQEVANRQHKGNWPPDCRNRETLATGCAVVSGQGVFGAECRAQHDWENRNGTSAQQAGYKQAGTGKGPKFHTPMNAAEKSGASKQNHPYSEPSEWSVQQVLKKLRMHEPGLNGNNDKSRENCEPQDPG